jgi:hypothetical protein
MSLPGAQTALDFSRPTYTADAYGGQVPSFSAVYSSVVGSLQPAKGRTVEEFARRGMQIDFVFYTAQAITLDTNDRASDGTNYYNVEWFSPNGMAGQSRYYAAYLKRKD